MSRSHDEGTRAREDDVAAITLLAVRYLYRAHG